MNPMIRFLALVVGGAVIVAASVAWAGDPSAYGPEGKRFGAGIYLGEPTGITLKGYPGPRLAIDGIAAWSFYENSVTFIGAVTYDFIDIPVSTSVITLPFYAGVGGKLAIDRGGKDDGRTTFGLRVPVGIAVQYTRHPVEIFFEVAPGLRLVPATDFDLTGGVGVRFYF